MRQPRPLTLLPIHFPVVKPREKLSKVVYNALNDEGLKLHRGDLLAVASKIVSASEGRIVKLADVHVTGQARRLSLRWELDERLAAVVLKEADEIIGGVRGFLLTKKNGVLTPNAGVDLKNSPPGTATLWPTNPDGSARELRRSLERRFEKGIGVEIVDSHVTALRLGTVGLAIGVSGFTPVHDHRGIRDIFGRPIRVTQTNLADDIASASHLLMGESSERVGAVLVRNSAIEVSATGTGRLAKLNSNKCLIASSFGHTRRITPRNI